MSADHLSYKRATGVCLIGLSIQVVLAAIVIVYARLGADPGAMTGGLAILLGVPVWVVLALVFHQHRLERLEALESEAYASSSAAQASVFDEAGAAADQQAHAVRLAWMHRWFLPSASLVLGGLFVGLGALRLWITTPEDSDAVASAFRAPPEPGWAISIGVGIAVIGFIFARFVAGMAKERVWQLLHAGSGTAVTAALIGAALTVAHFVSAALGSTALLRFLPSALAVLMIALGVEVFLNFVLNLYRPRRVGEYQRPAFDSRVLAFVAAPDRLAESISEAINYQFGFNVSATWFYRLLARSVLSLGVLAVATLWLLSIFSVVRPHERGLLLRNGQLVREVRPGLVVDLPWPWSRIERFPADAVNELSLGTPKPSKEGPILWTNEHTPNERYLLVQAPRANAGGAGVGGGGSDGAGARGSGDLNLVAMELPVHYIVRDLKKYTALAQDGPRGKADDMRRDLLKAAASGAVMQHVATLSVDDVLGPARRSIAARIRELVQARFDAMDAGVEVIFAGVAGVHPEQSVAPAFEEVVAADQKRLAAIEAAEADAIRSLAGVVGDVDRARSIMKELDVLDATARESGRGPDAAAKARAQEQKIIGMITSAGGEASVLIAQARAERWRIALSARARAAANQGLIASFRAAPAPFQAARLLGALREASRQARVWIVPPSVRVRLNQEEVAPVIDAFAPNPSGDATTAIP